MVRVLRIMLLLALLPAVAAAAQEGRAVTLEEAVGLALVQNHAVKAAREAALAERAGIGAARSGLLPKVRFEERYLRTDNPTMAFSSKLNQGRFEQADFAIGSLNGPADINDFQTSLSFEQPLFVREAWLGLDMAKKQAAAAGFDQGHTEEQTALEAVKTFLSVQTAGEFVKAAQKGLEEAGEHKRIAEARFREGLGILSDTLRTDVLHKEAEQRLLEAELRLKVARRALGMVLGLDEPVDVIPGGREPGLLALEAYTEAALGRNDVSALEARLQNAQNAVSMANAKYMPQVGVGGSYQWNDHEAAFGSEGQSYQVMAFLRWSVFDGAQRRSERAESKHRVRQAEERLEGLRKFVAFSVYRAYLGVEEARKSLELALSRRELAEEGLRLVGVRYENSLSTVVELIDAQAALDAARAGVVKARNGYLSALAELNFESGMIIETYGAAESR